MKYGFNDMTDAVKLPSLTPQRKPEPATDLAKVRQTGVELGFVSRDAAPVRRKSGPKRTEPQDRITIAGPKRVMDRLKAYCDQRGGISYHEALEALLDQADR